METVEFAGARCNVEVSTYGNGNTSLQLREIETGHPYGTASTNVANTVLEPEQVMIKNWGENEGILEALKSAGIISEPVTSVFHNGFEIPVCNVISKLQ